MEISKIYCIGRRLQGLELPDRGRPNRIFMNEVKTGINWCERKMLRIGLN